jgi:hypothetical protein
MTEKCWEILNKKSPLKRSCKECPAYIENKNCWEVEGTPCSSTPAICVLIDCPVYKRNKEKIKEAIQKSLKNKSFSEIYHQMKAVSEKRCWDFKGCPPETYTNCLAFTASQNCWDIKECICKLEGSEVCTACPIYIFYAKFK